MHFRNMLPLPKTFTIFPYIVRKIIHFIYSRAALLAMLIVAAGVAAWLFARIRQQEKQNATSALRYISSDAAFAMRINDPRRLCEKINHDGTLASLLRSDIYTQDLARTLLWLADTFAQKNTYFNDFMKQTWWISAHIFDTRICYLFAVELPKHLYIKNIDHIIDHLSRCGFTTETKPYNNEKITTFSRSNDETFHIAVVQRVALISASRVLVETAIRNAVESSIGNAPFFSQAAAAAGTNVDANIYIPSEQMQQLLMLYLRYPYRSQAAQLAQLGNIIVLDATLKTSSILLNGFIFNYNIKNSCLNILHHQKPQPLTIPDILPRSTDGMYSFSISNVKKLLADYESFHNFNTNEHYSKQIDALAQKINYNPAELFAALNPVEVALAHIPLSGTSKEEQWFIVIKSANIDAAKHALNSRIAAIAKSDKKKESQYQQKFTLANNAQITLFNNPSPNLTETLLGNMFSACNDKYIWYLGEYIIMGAAPAPIKEFAIAAMSKHTLSQGVNISNYTSSLSNIFIYLNPKREDAHYLQTLKPHCQQALQASALSAATEAMGAQLRFENINGIYCSIFYLAHGNVDESKNTNMLTSVFETRLNAPMLQPPWLIKNHRSKQNNLLVQDKKHTIYLIDNNGVILWKRSIDAAIIGGVQQVDLYKNKKWQMVFNTKSKLYAIDILGRNVKSFPIALNAPATAPVAAFDYDKNRNYRFFVPCSDGRIAVYDGLGKRVSGFEPYMRFDAITQPVLHIRRAGKDFIVVTDSRKVHILDRKGNERVATEEIFPAPNSITSCEYAADGSAARLSASDANGNILAISLDNGAVEKIPIAVKLNEKHHYAATPANDYMLLSGKELMVYGSNLKLKMAASTKTPPNTKPLCFWIDAHTQFYSVHCAQDGKTYLWNAQGALHNGFPMSAAVQASVVAMNKNGGSIIIIGDQNGYISGYELQ
jgi:hypothetical protein